MVIKQDRRKYREMLSETKSYLAGIELFDTYEK